jgi:hypothetical protein
MISPAKLAVGLLSAELFPASVRRNNAGAPAEFSLELSD